MRQILHWFGGTGYMRNESIFASRLQQRILVLCIPESLKSTLPAQGDQQAQDQQLTFQKQPQPPKFCICWSPTYVSAPLAADTSGSAPQQGRVQISSSPHAHRLEKPGLPWEWPASAVWVFRGGIASLLQNTPREGSQ